MSRVIAVVEGRTEQAFVKNVLAPWLSVGNIYIAARLVGKPGHKGGANYSRARTDITALLRQESETFVTTMFDFYGMPLDWPGREAAGGVSITQKASTVERALEQDIADAYTHHNSRFFAYVQMHEFESLLFADPETVGLFLGDSSVTESLSRIRRQFSSPEQINDSWYNAPSKRLQRIVKNYDKTFHGTVASQKIGIEKIRMECPHFDDWISKLESL